MSKICIISDNELFLTDLTEQIHREVSDVEILERDNADKADILLVDENLEELKNLMMTKKERPSVFFSSGQDGENLADIVIRKPFVLATFLRSLNSGTLMPKIRRKECICFKEYSLYPVNKEITSSLSGETLVLTEKEVSILKYLYQNVPAVVSKEDLLKDVWQYSTGATTHTVETHIYRLRQKIEQNGGSQAILTENGGYRLNI